jgi:2-hydroxychromene-2-carboxylate isomerase
MDRTMLRRVVRGDRAEWPKEIHVYAMPPRDSMTHRLEFHFDFGSPNAYLSHLVIPEIESRTGVRFVYVPVLLGGVFKLTGNVSPAVSLRGIKNKPEYESLEMRRFVERHGITEFEMNPHFPVNTLQIMRGAIVARREGFLDRYVDAVYHHMWAEPKKMDDPVVIRSALESSRLDAGLILERIQHPDVKAELVSNTEGSVERGVFGSPSFFVGDALYFGKDRLADVEREIMLQSQDAAAVAATPRASGSDSPPSHRRR